MGRQIVGSSLLIVLMASVPLGTAFAQKGPGTPLPKPTPAQLATFEVKVRDLYTGYAVPAEITIKPRIPEPTGDGEVHIPDIYTGPAGPGKLLFKRRAADPTANSKVHVPDASTGPGSSGEVLSQQSTSPAQQESIMAAPLTVRADMNGPTFFSLEPGVYDLSESAEGYEPGTTYFTAEPGATLPIKVMLKPLTPPERLSSEAVMAKLKPGFVVFNGHVVDDFNGQPLAGVSVSLVKSGVQMKTDADGYFFLQVPAPPQTEWKPNEMPPTEDLIAELPGYKQYHIINHILEYGGQFTIDLERGKGVTEKDHTHGLYVPHRSEQPVPPPDSQGSVGPLDSPSSFDVASASGEITPQIVDGSAQHPVRQIIVGTNCPQGTGCSTNCTQPIPLSLEEYVKNGLDNEWQAAWTKDALKAGAVAYRTYAAYRMYQRDIGQPFYNANYDICDNACCQVNDFAPPTPTIPTDYSRALIETKGVILTVDGTRSQNASTAWRVPAFSEYSAVINGIPNSNPNLCEPQKYNLTYCKANEGYGTGYAGSPSTGWPCMAEPVAVGRGSLEQCFGHNRGMSQWGSYWWTLPPNNKDWKWIVNHYYNNNGSPQEQRSIFFATEAERRVARGAEGRLHAFMWGTDSAFWYLAQAVSGSSPTYSGWTPLYGCLISTPVSAVTAQGQIEVFGQGCDTGLWRNTLAGWNRIDLTGGAPAWLSYEEPDVARDVNGRLHPFMRDTSGIIWRGNPQGNGNYLWSSLGGPAMAGPAEVIRHANATGSFQLFAPGYGDVWTAYQVSTPQFSALSSLGHPLVGNTNWYIDGNPFPVINKNKRWEIFVVACSEVPGQGCSLWTRRTTVTGPGVGGLTAWTNLGGNFISDCDGAINGAGGLEIFAIGSDWQMYRWSQAGPESPIWGGSILLAPSGITWTSVPSVLRNADGRLEVFVRGSDSGLWHNWETSPMGKWVGWQPFGGGVGGF